MTNKDYLIPSLITDMIAKYESANTDSMEWSALEVRLETIRNAIDKSITRRHNKKM